MLCAISSAGVWYLTFCCQPLQVRMGYNGLSSTRHIAMGQNTSLEHYLKVVHTSYLLNQAQCTGEVPFVLARVGARAMAMAQLR